MKILDYDRARDAGSLREFASAVWDRPTSEAYWRWWFACPAIDGVVAYGDDGRLQAVLFGMRRAYDLGGGVYDCLEPFDWFSRPELVGSTIGVSLMRRLQKRECPIVVLGANPVAAQVMRVLGFREIADGRTYWLPFGPQPLRDRGRDTLTARTFGLVGQVTRATWRRARPAGAELRLVNGVPGDMAAPEVRGTSGAVAPRPDSALLHWWRNAPPEVGVYLPFQVDVNGTAAIWAVARVAGADQARRSWMLEWHDRARDPALAEWALTTVLDTLVRVGSSAVYASTSDPELHRQFGRLRFRVDGHPVALLWLPKSGPRVEEQVRLMGSQADNSYLPLV